MELWLPYESHRIVQLHEVVYELWSELGTTSSHCLKLKRINLVETLTHVACIEWVDDVLASRLADACVDKLLAYSVLQYLGDESNVNQALHEVARVLKPGGRALLAANPDSARRPAYEAVVRKHADQAEMDREIALLDNLLWLPGSRLIELAQAAGLSARVEPISTRIWQHFYMFDLVLDKAK